MTKKAAVLGRIVMFAFGFEREGLGENSAQQQHDHGDPAAVCSIHMQ
jgi:hypothetical protein